MSNDKFKELDQKIAIFAEEGEGIFIKIQEYIVALKRNTTCKFNCRNKKQTYLRGWMDGYNQALADRGFPINEEDEC